MFFSLFLYYISNLIYKQQIYYKQLQSEKSIIKTKIVLQEKPYLMKRQKIAIDPLRNNNCRQSDFITHVKQNIQQAKCMWNKEAILYCCKKDCQQNALICSDFKCQCKTKHQFCFNNFQSQTLLKYIDIKQQKSINFIKQIQDKIDIIIDQLSALKDNLTETNKYIYFEEQQLNILNYVQNKKWKQLTGSTLNIFYFNIQVQKIQLNQSSTIKNLKIKFQQFNQSMEKIIHNFDLSLDSNDTINQKALKPLRIWYQQNNLNSKIITNFQELKTLNYFMPNNRIKELKLLYRASQNQFSTKIFFQKCSDIPNTLTLIKTEYNKIVGGYTPIPWKKYQTTNQLKDLSGQTFIFSLTNKDKLIMINNQIATFYFNQNWGPLFGKESYPDLSIKNNGHTEACSIVLSSQNFKNQKYDKENPKSYEQFTGSSTNKFKTLQWEVFEVVF